MCDGFFFVMLFSRPIKDVRKASKSGIDSTPFAFLSRFSVYLLSAAKMDFKLLIIFVITPAFVSVLVLLIRPFLYGPRRVLPAV